MDVAQLVAHDLAMVGVAGSSPVVRSSGRPVDPKEVMAIDSEKVKLRYNEWTDRILELKRQIDIAERNKDALILVLRRHQMTPAEIAEFVGLTVNQVQKRIQNARRFARKNRYE